jgi:hypothetical protein
MSHAEIETLLSFLCKLLRAQKKVDVHPTARKPAKAKEGGKKKAQEIDAWLLCPAQPTLPQV